MRDHDRHTRSLADGDGLAHRLDQLRGLVAHVRGVDAAIGTHRLRELDHLFGRSVLGRRIVEPGGHPDRALFERGFQRAPHRIDLSSGGRTVEGVHRAGA
jgi:hypothetical protein